MELKRRNTFHIMGTAQGLTPKARRQNKNSRIQYREGKKKEETNKQTEPGKNGTGKRKTSSTGSQPEQDNMAEGI